MKKVAAVKSDKKKRKKKASECEGGEGGEGGEGEVCENGSLTSHSAKLNGATTTTTHSDEADTEEVTDSQQDMTSCR